MIKILLAEDHNVVRDGIKTLLEKQSDIEVIGEAVNGQDAIDQVNRGNIPDLILVDINMEGMNGIELIKIISKQFPGIKCIVLSMLDQERFIRQAFDAGCSGYLLKTIPSIELLFAIRYIMTNQTYVCAEVSMRYMHRSFKAPLILKTHDTICGDFSERDTEVLHLIADGFTNQEIADKLFTSKRTVEGYRQQLLQKTGTRNSAALVKYAAFNNLIS